MVESAIERRPTTRISWRSSTIPSSIPSSTPISSALAGATCAGPVIGLAVATMCRYHRLLAYPDTIDAGLRAGKLGRSNVRYEMGPLSPGHDEPAATGHFVHVFVDGATRRPQSILELIGSALARLLPPKSHTNR
jgi:hypothetical protein